MHRFLVLSCSQRKRPDPGLLPALERYNGPAFQVLRKFFRIYPGEARSLDIHILSAEFGLIPSDQPIPPYDRRMTAQRASELQPQVLARLKQHLETGEFKKLFISVGNDYLRSLSGYEQFVPRDINVTLSTCSQGRKLSELRDWLYDGSPLPHHHPTGIVPRGKAHIRGVEVALTPEQVLDVARRALAEGQGDPDRYQSWYVEVDGQHVAPKWLVSQLTGLPVSTFVTDEARSVLAQLGFEVRRV